ncbi:MAG: TetR/AcrR family transcriptional regulator [Melioribacteraceae bacterium]|nr:TetR/AcrR family transcriptional regulator [Melioribacteraceae bacterium]
MRIKEGNKEKDILQAAVKVFAEYGYHNAKISKIAELANVATGSVYVYFKNKKDVLLRIFEDLWEVLYKEAKKSVSSKSLTPDQKMDKLIDVLFDVFSVNPSLAIVFVNEQNHLILSEEGKFQIFYDKFLDLGEIILREGIKAKQFSSQLDRIIFRVYIFGAIRNLLHRWAQDPDQISLEKIRHNVKHITKFGISIK